MILDDRNKRFMAIKIWFKLKTSLLINLSASVAQIMTKYDKVDDNNS